MTQPNTRSLLILPGDGIGPEVVSQARRVLEFVIAKRRLPIRIEQRAIGIEALKSEGSLLPDATFTAIKAADAILFGAMGGPGYDGISREQRRAGSLLRIRQELGLYANLRPVKPFAALLDSTPFKPAHIADVDMVIVRELNGGLYFGEPRGVTALPGGGRRGVNSYVYTTPEIQRIARVAFELARTRRGHVTSVDKANVMDAGGLWREEVQALHDSEYPDVALDHLYVDNCAMQIVENPARFDVLLTDITFGDILSDCAAPILGSLGMLPSSSLNLTPGVKAHALYEPIHGSAPDIAGKGVANPIAAILSLAMLLRGSFEAPTEADLIEQAVAGALARGYRTADIARGAAVTSTSGMGEAILSALDTMV